MTHVDSNVERLIHTATLDISAALGIIRHSYSKLQYDTDGGLTEILESLVAVGNNNHIEECYSCGGFAEGVGEEPNICYACHYEEKVAFEKAGIATPADPTPEPRIEQPDYSKRGILERPKSVWELQPMEEARGIVWRLMKPQYPITIEVDFNLKHKWRWHTSTGLCSHTTYAECFDDIDKAMDHAAYWAEDMDEAFKTGGMG